MLSPFLFPHLGNLISFIPGGKLGPNKGEEKDHALPTGQINSLVLCRGQEPKTPGGKSYFPNILYWRHLLSNCLRVSYYIVHFAYVSYGLPQHILFRRLTLNENNEHLNTYGIHPTRYKTYPYHWSRTNPAAHSHIQMHTFTEISTGIIILYSNHAMQQTVNSLSKNWINLLNVSHWIMP